jgi:hypothetical protein
MTTAELWFFFNSDGTIITVLGRESALGLGQLLSKLGQGQNWKIRKNQSQTALPINEFLELIGGMDSIHGEVSSISKMVAIKNKPAEVKQAATPVKKAEPEEIELPKMTENQWKKEKTKTQKLSLDFDKPETTKALLAQLNQKPKGSDKRRYERVEVRLRVVVIAGTRSFRSFSRNISKGGLLLENEIPKDVMNQQCRVIISSSDLKENIEFEAKLSGDSKNPKALSFQKGNDVFISKLESWLNKK